MSDGDVIHEWVDGEKRMRVKHLHGLLLVQTPALGGYNWIDMPLLTRTDARELLVAFDKLEGKV